LLHIGGWLAGWRASPLRRNYAARLYIINESSLIQWLAGWRASPLQRNYARLFFIVRKLEDIGDVRFLTLY
jgi:ribosome modulation factor